MNQLDDPNVPKPEIQITTLSFQTVEAVEAYWNLEAPMRLKRSREISQLETIDAVKQIEYDDERRVELKHVQRHREQILLLGEREVIALERIAATLRLFAEQKGLKVPE